MRPSRAADRATLALGVASLVSAVAGLPRGTFGFVHLGPGGFAVALVLGVTAAAGGWYSQRLLVLAAGVAYLLAAVVQAVLIGRHGDILGGDGSTVSVWLGLGVGLLVLAATPASPEPTVSDGRDNRGPVRRTSPRAQGRA